MTTHAPLEAVRGQDPEATAKLPGFFPPVRFSGSFLADL